MASNSNTIKRQPMSEAQAEDFPRLCAAFDISDPEEFLSRFNHDWQAYNDLRQREVRANEVRVEAAMNGKVPTDGQVTEVKRLITVAEGQGKSNVVAQLATLQDDLDADRLTFSRKIQRTRQVLGLNDTTDATEEEDTEEVF